MAVQSKLYVAAQRIDQPLESYNAPIRALLTEELAVYIMMHIGKFSGLGENTPVYTEKFLAGWINDVFKQGVCTSELALTTYEYLIPVTNYDIIHQMHQLISERRCSCPADEYREWLSIEEMFDKNTRDIFDTRISLNKKGS